MKSNFHRLMPILLAGMFVYSGCAKQEIVKKDQPLASSLSKPAEVAASKPQLSATGKESTPLGAAADHASPPNGGEQAGSQQKQAQAAAADAAQAFEKIYFDFDAATLSAAARETLARSFDSLKQNQQIKLRIEGHCDERGSDDYNLALSERRAQSAHRYLTALGIPAERLSTIGYGKEKPADPGHDEKAWAANRRDEFVVIK